MFLAFEQYRTFMHQAVEQQSHLFDGLIVFAFQEVADEFRDDIPVLMVDVREGRDVRRLVMTLLFTI